MAEPLVKGNFTVLDFTGAILSRIIFEFNPVKLTRTLSPMPVGLAAGGAPVGPQFQMPHETIQFRLKLDLSDQPAGNANGIYGPLSAIELLMYPSLPDTNQLTVFEWGERRIIPVEVTGLEFIEEAFDPQLNPIRAEVAVTLLVLNQPGMPDWKQALALAHFNQLRQLAQLP